MARRRARFDRLGAFSVAVLAAAVLLLTPLAVSAASAESASTGDVAPVDRPVIVGTKVAAPFVMKSDDGGWSGVSIDLWRSVADRLGLEFEIRETDIEGLLAGVENGEYDVGVAALTVTPERESVVDFTHPFFSTGLGIAVQSEGGSGWSAVAASLVSREFLTVVLALALVLLLSGLLVWFLERRRNPDQFGGTTAQGIGSGFWWAAVTMTTVGYGDKAPATFGGRIAALIWMFASLIIISTFTAAIASALTVGSLQGPIQGPEDLGRGRVGSVVDTAPAQWLSSRGFGFERYDTVEAAMDALAAGRLDAVVYDAPILRYLAHKQRGGSVSVLPREFEPQDYAFVLPSGSPLRESLNVAILESLGERAWEESLTRYLGR